MLGADDDRDIEGLIGRAIPVAGAVGGGDQNEDGRAEPELPTDQKVPSSALGPYIDGSGTSCMRR